MKDVVVWLTHMTKRPRESSYLNQWKLVRSAIEHENTLKSHRVTWFLATQLFLFTGFTSVFVEAVKNDYLFRSLRVYTILIVILFVGVYMCLLAWANLRAAQKMITRLQTWWLIECHESESDEKRDLKKWIYSAKYGEKSLPPVNGVFTSNLHLIFDEALLPVALAIFWVILFSATTAIFLNKRFGNHPIEVSAGLVLIGILLYDLGAAYRESLRQATSRNARELASIAVKRGFCDEDLERRITEHLDQPFE